MPRRRSAWKRGLVCCVGACALAVGCQSTQAPRATLPSPPPVAKAATVTPANTATTSRWFSEWFSSSKKPKGNAATAPPSSAWKPANRPSLEPTSDLRTVGYPSTQGGSGLASAASLSPPPLGHVVSGPILDPGGRIVPIPASPAPRMVDHTAIGPIGGIPPHELNKKVFPAYRVEPSDILLIQVLRAKPIDDPENEEDSKDKPASDPGKKDPGKEFSGGKSPDKKDAEKPSERRTGSFDIINDTQPIQGPHLVRPDGTVGLGVWGEVQVAGMTLEEVRQAVTNHLNTTRARVDIRNVAVDVIYYNTKFCYVIVDGGGFGEQIVPIPFTGTDTVLDGLARIGGLPAVSDKTKVIVARRGPGDQGQILPVDYVGITQRGGTVSNYQLFPGDRIYVKADHWIKFDTELGKRLSPLERLMGATLLGGEAANSIRNLTR